MRPYMTPVRCLLTIVLMATLAATPGYGVEFDSEDSNSEENQSEFHQPVQKSPILVAYTVLEVGLTLVSAATLIKSTEDTWFLRTPRGLDGVQQPFYVTENAKLKLPGIEGKAGLGWYPYKYEPTRVDFEFLLNGLPAGKGSYSVAGFPTKAQWDRYYADDGPYPAYYATKLNNDYLNFTFDAEGTAEAFKDGINTVSVRLSGFTTRQKNWWEPDAWGLYPCAKAPYTGFATLGAQNRDIAVDIPFFLRKNPNKPRVEQPHPANLTVELWSQNLARQDYGGNVQHFEAPQVTTVCGDGTVPPSDGTSNAEVLMCEDTRTHSAPNHSDLVHVLPDFTPIQATVIYKTWDLAKNRGRRYEKTKTFPPLELWCRGTGEPVVSADDPDSTQYSTTPTPRQAIPDRSIVTPSSTLNDPDFGPIADGYNVDVEVVSLGLGQPTQTMVAHGAGSDFWSCLDCVASGDLVELRFTIRDLFGRTFEDTIMVDVPDTLNLSAPDSIVTRGANLTLVNQETVSEGLHDVEFRVMDLAALAWGELAPVAGLLIEDAMAAGSPQYVSNATGAAYHQVTDGARMAISVTDTSGRYSTLTMPLSPPVLKPLTLTTGIFDPIVPDDRVWLWMSPALDTAVLEPAVGKVKQDGTDWIIKIGAVSKLDSLQVGCAEWRHLDGQVIGPAVILPWGGIEDRNLGYVPVRFSLPESLVDDATLCKMLWYGAVELRVCVIGDTEHVVQVDLSDVQFEDTDGSGYCDVCDQQIEIDTIQSYNSAGAPASPLAANFVTVRGLVTVSSGTYNPGTYYVEDATGGIMVYDESEYFFEGDEVLVRGLVSDFGGELQISDNPAWTLVLFGVPVTPTTLNIHQIVDPAGDGIETLSSGDYELVGSLLSTIGTVASITPGFNTTVEIATGPDTLTVFIDGTTGIDVSAIALGDRYSFTGPLSNFNGLRELKPRTQADVVEEPSTAVDDDTPSERLVLTLLKPHPNPFNPQTTIEFVLPGAGDTRLVVFDQRGRKVSTLIQGPMSAGAHSVKWNGRDEGGRGVASGIYYVRLQFEHEHAQVQKVNLVK